MRAVIAASKLGGRRGRTLYLSPSIADLIPKDERFIPELTDEGILFRRVASANERRYVPSWALDTRQDEV